MTKIAALDVGDQWTGVALSDTLQMFARPATTVKTKDLFSFLAVFLDQEPIKTIVIGLPKTMKGRISQQTEKVLTVKENLERAFPFIKWIAWDERLSSKRAQELQKSRKKDLKQSEHAVAAAFILDSYLVFYHNKNNILV